MIQKDNVTYNNKKDNFYNFQGEIKEKFMIIGHNFQK